MKVRDMKQLRIINDELRNGFVSVIRTFSPLRGSSLSLRSPKYSYRSHSGGYPVICNYMQCRGLIRNFVIACITNTRL